MSHLLLTLLLLGVAAPEQGARPPFPSPGGRNQPAPPKPALPSGAADAPAPPPAAPAQAPARTQDLRDYVVGPQDVLKIGVFEEPQLSGSFRVDTDGTIQYPFLKLVQVGGRTLRSIEEELTRRLAEGFVRRPQVSVEVEQYRPRSLFVVGEVRTPGKYPLTANMSLIEALAQAGYTTPSAGGEVLIVRSGSGDAAAALTQDATNSAVRINLAELQAGQLTSNVTLREGDTVFVPKAEKFYVTGFVRSPGAFTFERGMTVLQAVSLAGGISEKGSTRGIRVLRLVKGEKKEFDLKMEDLVQPNDTIIVRQARL